MNANFAGTRYTLKKQKVALTGIYRIYDENKQLIAYSKQKALKLREEVRVFADEKQTQEIMMIKANKAIDFSASYNITDSANNNALIGTLRRKGLKSMTRDTWELLAPNGQVIGTAIEDSAFKATMRRLLLGSLLPQSFDVTVGTQQEMLLKQRFSMIGYEMEVNFTANGASQLDRRVGIALAVMLAVIEGKQN